MMTSKNSATETPGLANVNIVLQKVFDTTEDAINNLAEGERIFLKVLTSRVAAFLALPLSTVGPFVSLWTKKNTDKCTVQKGRFGGIYKGKLPQKKDLAPRCQHCGQKLRAKPLTKDATSKAPPKAA